MNEEEFKARWHDDRPVYQAWGHYVVTKISNELSSLGKDVDTFLKVPAKSRLKDDSSLIDKAFYRKKSYKDPYNDIEDKVGARFVVLLLDDVDLICSVVQSLGDWAFDACKHFKEDMRNNPLLFTYKSVHYILRPKQDFEYNDCVIRTDVACELQIRTLLQHAHSELTHDSIYKSEREVRPEVHRTVAKSMALIETTDEFFSHATKLINYGPFQEFGIGERLDSVYKNLVGLVAHSQKSSFVVWSEYESFISGGLVEDISKLLERRPDLVDRVSEKYSINVFCQQSVVLFLYWMLLKRKQRLIKDWPLDESILNMLANDAGVSLNE
ncbi:GTP pyrophosphokinase [Pseudomonas chlororaphis]|uniref:GTP pyrophosphokinase n=1 Tax=Pseudomonas chlororaphis TaxID=587753 RepID=UPI0009B8855B|nr:RelA/SpoT domain-containing protein [Pseudomonas chlororaphis]AZD27577.1 GTP pyrophosphokinase [Pseudomonas chlororaphis]QFS53174.1 (p)ppGpp synthetase [Pseudomonas chlororaphis subsp. aurantiaca]